MSLVELTVPDIGNFTDISVVDVLIKAGLAIPIAITKIIRHATAVLQHSDSSILCASREVKPADDGVSVLRLRADA